MKSIKEITPSITLATSRVFKQIRDGETILSFFSYHARNKRIIKVFLFSLHAFLYAIINLHVRRDILDLAYQKIQIHLGT